MEKKKTEKVEKTPSTDTKGKFSTKDGKQVEDLISKGFHVKEQTIVDGELLYVFKESKAEIEKA